MTIEPRTLKGFRDFLPKEARKRQYVIEILKKVFESYGFEPLETPTLEYEEILLGKYGDEGDKLMYRFEDNGARRVALKYDQTVPLARVVAQYQNDLPLPFKRYQIQNVFRADNTQKGRFREFLQCDIDTVGSSSSLADAEILELIYQAYRKLGLDVTIKINDRALLSKISTKALGILDKLEKIGEEEVKKELEKIGESTSLLDEAKEIKESSELQEIQNLAFKLGCPENSIEFEPIMVRGLDYYTGIIMEVVLKNSDSKLSLGGGGRYDNLIGMFAERQIPAVGFSFGFDRVIEAMDALKLFPENLQTTKALVTVFSSELLEKSIEVCEILSKNNISQELYIDENAKLEKQLKYADRKKIPFAIIISPEEVKQNKVNLKNLQNGSQVTISKEELIIELNTPISRR